LKVQFLTASLGQSGGGVSLAMAELARELSAQDVAVSVRGIEDGEPPVLSPLNFLTETHAVSQSWPWRQSRLLRDASRADRCDLIHTHGLWTDCSVAAESAGRANGTPIVVSPHGMLDLWALKNSRWKKKLASILFESRHLKRAACLHALCAAEVAAIRSYGLKNPVALIPNGVCLPDLDLSDLASLNSSAATTKALLFLGRLHPKKGLAELIGAWAALQVKHGGSQNLGWHLVVAGWEQGRHRIDLLRRCRDLKIEVVETTVADYLVRKQHTETSLRSGTVVFAGAAFGDNKDRLLRSADGFILPSFSEGLPMAVLEAWAYGLPVAMTDACNLPVGFQSGAACWLPPPDNAAELASRLSDFLSQSESELSAMGQLGRTLVQQQFTWSRVAEQFAAVYRWLTGKAGQPDCVNSPFHGGRLSQ